MISLEKMIDFDTYTKMLEIVVAKGFKKLLQVQ